VDPLSCGEDFDVFEDGQARLCEAGEGAPGEEFGFKGAPKVFHVGVVVAVSAAVHAHCAAVLAKDLAIVGQGI
jgi:hypothetical protein